MMLLISAFSMICIERKLVKHIDEDVENFLLTSYSDYMMLLVLTVDSCKNLTNKLILTSPL